MSILRDDPGVINVRFAAYVTEPHASPKGAERLGVSVLDDEGVIRPFAS